MLPDTFLGAVTMALVNMTVVFAVLAFLALVIRAIHGFMTKMGYEEEETPRKQVLVVSSHSGPQEGELFLPDDIDPVKKAAILAAISVYMGRPETSMFLRDKKDRGAWGRLSGKLGISGSYRSGQLTKERQIVGNRK